uniref:Putative odorant-binding protein 15 n=1 Tax=Anthonomus grandis TaxID=7044 RepID=A0A2P1A497_ANTGR|nr:putative odorant-binding protein 15 [Anthonomus grandis]
MKVVIALTIFVVLAAGAAIDKEQVQQKMRAGSEKCLNHPAVGVDKDELKTYRESKGQAPKPANLNKLSMCILKENGWLKDDNTINTSEVKQILELGAHDHPKTG